MQTENVAEIAAGLSEREREALDDLCRIPGLFVGLYDDLDILPTEFKRREYAGAAGLMGVAKAYPTPLGLAVRAHIQENRDD